jgi:hypothetical protein
MPPEIQIHSTPCQHSLDTRDRLDRERDENSRDHDRIWETIERVRDRVTPATAAVLAAAGTLIGLLGGILAAFIGGAWK